MARTLPITTSIGRYFLTDRMLPKEPVSDERSNAWQTFLP